MYCSHHFLIKIRFHLRAVTHIRAPTRVVCLLPNRCNSLGGIRIFRKSRSSRLRPIRIHRTITSSLKGHLMCFLVSALVSNFHLVSFDLWFLLSFSNSLILLLRLFSGWSNDNANRGPYPRVPYTNAQGNVPATPPQQWNQGPMPRPPVPNSQPPNTQWDRYPPNSQQQQFPPQVRIYCISLRLKKLRLKRLTLNFPCKHIFVFWPN